LQEGYCQPEADDDAAGSLTLLHAVNALLRLLLPKRWLWGDHYFNEMRGRQLL